MSKLFGDVETVEELQENWRDPYLTWYALGMPSFDQREKTPIKQIILKFKTKEDRHHFAEKMDYKLTDKTDVVWYPNKGRETNSTNRFIEIGYEDYTTLENE